MDKKQDVISLGLVPGTDVEMQAAVWLTGHGCSVDVNMGGDGWSFGKDDLLALIDSLTTVWLRMDEIERERR